MKTTLEHALAYIARGWSVFPLVPGTKRPAVELAPLLSGEMRYGETFAVDIWGPTGTGRDYGIGIICGAPSGNLVVVDVDPRNGGDCEQARRDAPTGYVVETGGGGLHLYCVSDGPVPKGKTGRPGVDRQGQGGYVVAPPSVHPDTGRAYRLVADGDLGRTPEWVTERLLSGLDSTAGGPWVAAVLADPAGVAPGSQHETLTRLAWWAAGHLDEDVAEVILSEWADRLPLSGRPWTVADVRSRLASAYEKRGAEEREAVDVTVADARAVRGVAGEGEGGSGAAAPRVSVRDYVRTAPVFCAAVEDDVEWLVPGILARGSQAQLTGNVKEGKSTLICTLIRALTRGEPFLGRPTPAQGTKCLLLSEQDGASLRATLVRAGLDVAGEENEKAIIIPRRALVGRPWREAVAEVVALCREEGIGLLVVDTLMALAGVGGDDENKAGVIHTVLAPFRAALAAECAVLYGRHAAKNQQAQATEDPFLASRGSTAIDGEVDTGLLLRSEDGQKVLHFKGRFDEVGKVRLGYKGGLYVVDDEVVVPV